MVKLLVTRLRQDWPEVRILARGDSAFCRQRLLRWCERNAAGYVIGVARNARLHRIVGDREREMADAYVTSQTKQRQIVEFRYASRQRGEGTVGRHPPGVRQPGGQSPLHRQ